MTCRCPNIRRPRAALARTAALTTSREPASQTSQTDFAHPRADWVDRFSYGSRNQSGTIVMQNNCFLSRTNDPFSPLRRSNGQDQRPRPNPVLEASLNRASQSATVVVAAKVARPPGEGETFFENSRRAVTSIPRESGLVFWLQCSPPLFRGEALPAPVEAWGFQPREKQHVARSAFLCAVPPAACSHNDAPPATQPPWASTNYESESESRPFRLTNHAVSNRHLAIRNVRKFMKTNEGGTF